MVVNMNAIPTGNGPGKESESQAQGSGINMHAIPIGENTRKGFRIDLKALIPEVLNPAARRARQAAGGEALAARRKIEEEERAQRLRTARRDIQEAARGPQRLADQPAIRAGWQPALGRLARKDPDEALQIAQFHVSQVQSANDVALAARRKVAEGQRQVEEKRRALDADPIQTTTIDLTRLLGRPDAQQTMPKKILKAGLQTASAVATVAARTILATVNGTPLVAFDSITIDTRGVHASAPFSEITGRDIPPDELVNHDIRINPPRWFDPVYAFLKTVPGIRADNLVPVGTIVVEDRRSRKIITQPVAFFPGRVLARMKKAMEETTLPKNGVAHEMVPEPTVSDLLQQAARAIEQDETQAAQPAEVVPQPLSVSAKNVPARPSSAQRLNRLIRSR